MLVGVGVGVGLREERRRGALEGRGLGWKMGARRTERQERRVRKERVDQEVVGKVEDEEVSPTPSAPSLPRALALSLLPPPPFPPARCPPALAAPALHLLLYLLRSPGEIKSFCLTWRFRVI